jgi:hypothetical protein
MLTLCPLWQSVGFTVYTSFHIHHAVFFTPSKRNAIESSMIKNLEINPSTKQALVTYNNNRQYLYNNVDEDAIFDMLFGIIDSFGKWVNMYCKSDEAVSVFKIAAN